ncbi:L-glutamate gamma-semialdehyde dehydrogenase [Isachenkonia alkalipeptolytica]|uniref:L-glutamate gamma-semialdehyde dehydrogenase n=1 Tax=Isachenkonia alkalipeptolytica TaxID=2565777 RepID=A0AA44BCF2_9CLOT|nr:L-glutamate gamma-semialdehyde dehydrogenase [Isachenkonia alkalipeptolytica]
MSNAYFVIEKPENEPILTYREGSSEKKEVKERLQELKKEVLEIPVIVNGEEIQTGNMGKRTSPEDHTLLLAEYHKAGSEEIEKAIEASMEAKKEWAHMPWEERAAIFLKAADLVAGPYRATINAATMLGQGKNIHQAEIDAACELIDFLRFNAYFMAEIMKDQPYSPDNTWNRMEYRPLDGFIFAVTPFNFTAIAGNLPTAPAMAGNTVIWKPASSAVYSAYFFMKILEEAGLPKGVINFLPGSGSEIGGKILPHRDLAGVHFTGSTKTFRYMWETVGKNISGYRNYPRIVGETGGKDFVVVHPSADTRPIATALVRGAFEYQGQKCSAASRAYIPKSLWPEIKEEFIGLTRELKVGSTQDFRNFVNPVIDKPAFEKITSYIDYAKESEEGKVLYGGTYDDSKGYFVDPTIIETTNPRFKTMVEEIFGPVITIFVYEDDQYDEILRECDEATDYGLTGSIFAKDREAVIKAQRVLQQAAGNFYINDKPTGSIVNQQPFGGARASGTNDKAGSKLNMQRWLSARAIKETYDAPRDYRYPCMEAE